MTEKILPVTDITLVFKSKGTSGFLDYIIEQSLIFDASDIHIDPYHDKAFVLLRIQGLLVPAFRFDKSYLPECIGRIKILSKLRTDVHNKAQDSRFDFLSIKKEKIDIRVSIMPTFYGENAVLRLLRPFLDRELCFSGLGMDSEQALICAKYVDSQQGVILISGPTGSGKTTTVYSFCKALIKAHRNIITVEDPVEYIIHGARQIQVSENHFGFSDALRSVLRQDPDVIVVGEIRDTETARLAFRSALTGHLVIATIHADGLSGVRGRLMDLGVEDSMMSLLKLVISQKLSHIKDHIKLSPSRKANFKFLELP
jgi:type IV pilus assembly protein PilB